MAKMLLGFMAVAFAVAAVGCAGRGGPSPIGDPDTPRVGWVIMHGKGDNPDEEFGCQSNPRSDCSVAASTPAAKALSEVHLYFHPTRETTTYSGVVKVGFFASAATSPGVKPQLTVKPGDVGNHSVVGIVTDKPGRYTMSVDVTAMKGEVEHHIREDVPVEVR